MFQVSDIDYLGNIIKNDEFDFSRSVHEAVSFCKTFWF